MQEQKKWFEFVARYQGDSEFAARVDADPIGEARHFGVILPEGVKLNVLKDTPEEINLVIPHQDLNDLGEEKLGRVQGGICTLFSGAWPCV